MVPITRPFVALPMDIPYPLYTVAYLGVDASARAFIDGFRRQHDPQVDTVAPHFTMVFGCKAVPQAAYIDHVAAIARQTPVIPFRCRYAMLGADDVDGKKTAYVFLVPDEGNSAISRLHDRLYTGVLAGQLQLEIPYVPHITVASTQDRQAAKALCDGLNQAGIDIAGQLQSLTVGALRDGRLQAIAEHPLATDT